MKKFLVFVVSFVVVLGSFFDVAFSQRARRRQASSRKTKRAGNIKRAATSGGSGAKSSGNTKKATGSKSKSKSSSSSKSGASSSSSSSSSSGEGLSAELKCLQQNISSLLGDKCKFVVDSDITSALEGEDLYCVYNYKDSGKTSSVYNYYLNAYYGVSETSVKSDTSIVNVKNSSKNALKYYQYLIDEIANGTLKESKILDSVTEKVLENSNVANDVQGVIEKKSVETVPLSMSIVSSDLENCTKATKAILKECGAIGNQTVKKKISESCTAYNAVLLKLAGNKKTEALGFEGEIINALKERANADFYDYKELVEQQAEKLKLDEQYAETQKKTKLLTLKNKRDDTASKLVELRNRIKGLNSDDSAKETFESQANTYASSLCLLDQQISSLDSTYKPSDNLAKCSDDDKKDDSDKKDVDTNKTSESGNTSSGSNDTTGKANMDAK